MVIRFEVEERINRPVSDVFEYVSTVENEPEWNPGVTDATRIDDEMEEGARWTDTHETPFGTHELLEECIVYEPPTRFGYETKDGLFGGRLRTTESVFHFSETDDGTQVTISGTTQVKGVVRLLQPLFARVIRSELQGQLTELQATLEETTD